ncbi:hypothetical protein QQZ08_007907 [Neonectria magnoliae]|uniref:Transcription factor domain-containing protein n=1 Tax=Neonectria magnoliae TaxID=2732573 RepID=A0ABR1HXR4_9HYPO
MVDGNVNDIDLLQGLLIHLAWAHYQPRPKRYTQHLHLAASIVCDLRLDRPRKPKLWSVHGGKDRNMPDWGPDEMRALIGVSSLLLQKSRHFAFTPYISRCCEHLAAQNEHQTDGHLVFIVHLQTLIEGLEDLVGSTSITNDAVQFETEMQKISQECAEIKSTLRFPLSKSPPLFLQLHMLELLLSQSSPRGTPFGLDKFQDNRNGPEQQASLMNWLSSSISAARSLISVVLVLPQGEEGAMSNVGWIITYCSLSLAVRLDLIAAGGGISGVTQNLRQVLDMPHTLRQIALRLEAAATLETDATAGGHHPFQDLATRVRRLEEWYFAHIGRQLAQPTTTISQPVADPSMVMDPNAVPGGDSMMSRNAWPGGSDWYPGPEVDLGTFLFTDPVDFSGMFAI